MLDNRSAHISVRPVRFDSHAGMIHSSGYHGASVINPFIYCSAACAYLPSRKYPAVSLRPNVWALIALYDDAAAHDSLVPLFLVVLREQQRIFQRLDGIVGPAIREVIARPGRQPRLVAYGGFEISLEPVDDIC